MKLLSLIFLLGFTLLGLLAVIAAPLPQVDNDLEARSLTDDGTDESMAHRRFFRFPVPSSETRPYRRPRRSLDELMDRDEDGEVYERDEPRDLTVDSDEKTAFARGQVVIPLPGGGMRFGPHRRDTEVELDARDDPRDLSAGTDEQVFSRGTIEIPAANGRFRLPSTGAYSHLPRRPRDLSADTDEKMLLPRLTVGLPSMYGRLQLPPPGGHRPRAGRLRDLTAGEEDMFEERSFEPDNEVDDLESRDEDEDLDSRDEADDLESRDDTDDLEARDEVDDLEARDVLKDRSIRHAFNSGARFAGNAVTSGAGNFAGTGKEYVHDKGKNNGKGNGHNQHQNAQSTPKYHSSKIDFDRSRRALADEETDAAEERSGVPLGFYGPRAETEAREVEDDEARSLDDDVKARADAGGDHLLTARATPYPPGALNPPGTSRFRLGYGVKTRPKPGDHRRRASEDKEERSSEGNLEERAVNADHLMSRSPRFRWGHGGKLPPAVPGKGVRGQRRSLEGSEERSSDDTVEERADAEGDDLLAARASGRPRPPVPASSLPTKPNPAGGPRLSAYRFRPGGKPQRVAVRPGGRYRRSMEESERRSDDDIVEERSPAYRRPRYGRRPPGRPQRLGRFGARGFASELDEDLDARDDNLEDRARGHHRGWPSRSRPVNLKRGDSDTARFKPSRGNRPPPTRLGPMPSTRDVTFEDRAWSDQDEVETRTVRNGGTRGPITNPLVIPDPCHSIGVCNTMKKHRREVQTISGPLEDRTWTDQGLIEARAYQPGSKDGGRRVGLVIPDPCHSMGVCEIMKKPRRDVQTIDSAPLEDRALPDNDVIEARVQNGGKQDGGPDPHPITIADPCHSIGVCNTMKKHRREVRTIDSRSIEDQEDDFEARESSPQAEASLDRRVTWHAHPLGQGSKPEYTSSRLRNVRPGRVARSLGQVDTSPGSEMALDRRAAHGHPTQQDRLRGMVGGLAGGIPRDGLERRGAHGHRPSQGHPSGPVAGFARDNLDDLASRAFPPGVRFRAQTKAHGRPGIPKRALDRDAPLAIRATHRVDPHKHESSPNKDQSGPESASPKPKPKPMFTFSRLRSVPVAVIQRGEGFGPLEGPDGGTE